MRYRRRLIFSLVKDKYRQSKHDSKEKLAVSKAKLDQVSPETSAKFKAAEEVCIHSYVLKFLPDKLFRSPSAVRAERSMHKDSLSTTSIWSCRLRRPSWR